MGKPVRWVPRNWASLAGGHVQTDNGRRGKPQRGCDCQQCFGDCVVDKEQYARERAWLKGRSPGYWKNIEALRDAAAMQDGDAAQPWQPRGELIGDSRFDPLQVLLAQERAREALKVLARLWLEEAR